MLCLVAQSCLTLCDPVDYSPPGSSVHGDSTGKNTGVGCHALLQGISPTQGSNSGLPHCSQILYHLSYQGSPRILEWVGQEATVRTGHGTVDWFQIGKGVHQGCILSPCLFNLYAEYIMRKLDWKEHKLESRLPGEISITSDMQMTPPLWQKVKRNSKAS